MSAASVHPSAQNASSSTTTRPRMRAGANSLTSVDATGSSAPRPSPISTRKARSDATFHDSAAAPVAAPYSRSVAANTVRRPMRSASVPPTLAPMAIPTNPAAPIHDSVAPPSFHCCASAAITNDTSPTSMASIAHPAPDTTTRRRCSRVNGSRSSRCERVSAIPSPVRVIPAASFDAAECYGAARANDRARGAEARP
jgi:hypothetical protein